MIDSIKKLYYFIYGYRLSSANRYALTDDIKYKQNKAFKALARYITNKSAHYTKYRNCSFNSFPIIDKRTFLAQFNSINTVGLSLEQCEKHGLQAEKCRNFSSDINGISVGLSSGTSGSRGVFLVSAVEQAQWAGYILAKNIPFSLKRQKVALFLRSNSNLYESANCWLIKFRFFDLTHHFENLLSALEDYQPDILIAPAHVLGLIANSQPEINPGKVISVAEVLEETTRQQVERQFRCRVDQIYQATEGYIASTCAHGSLHINEDILIVEKEWVDKPSGRFTPIVTDLTRRTLPIIRYRLDDILIENSTPCPCGSNFTRLNSIEGRADDILWLVDSRTNTLKGIFPDIVRRAMLICQKPVDDYRIEQRDQSISIAYESKYFEDAENEIRSALTRLFDDLNVHPPQLNFHLGIQQRMTDKLRRIKCQKKPDLIEE